MNSAMMCRNSFLSLFKTTVPPYKKCGVILQNHAMSLLLKAIRLS